MGTKPVPRVRMIPSGCLREALPPEEKGCYVYVLLCSDDALYTGWTTDLKQRLAAHNGSDGKSAKGAKCTRARRPVKLVYFESLETKSQAMKREAALKKLTRSQKLQLIRENPSESGSEDRGFCLAETKPIIL